MVSASKGQRPYGGPTWFFEEEARACGYRRVAGLDEAGRGPLAGPVVGAVVILPRHGEWPYLDDSKTVDPTVRDMLFEEITDRAIDWAIGLATEREIDALNILEATKLAWRRAVASLSCPPDFLLIDAALLPALRIPQRSVVKGDQLSFSIAAASILAKVHRDRVMHDYHQQYPSYQFHVHKGYPTPQHLRLLEQFGPCPAHRYSFRPVRDCSVVRKDMV
ncbi:MAG: ribonuclease HII [Nitrospirales bacterium]|nr:ribonuclease HII [Nitrospirales bacterium]